MVIILLVIFSFLLFFIAITPLPPYFSPNLFSSVFSSHGFDATIFYQPQVQPIAKSCQLCLHVALADALPSLHLMALLPRLPSALLQTAATANHVSSAPFNLFSTSTSKSAHSTFSTFGWFLSALRIKSRTAYEAMRGSPTASLQPQHILTLPFPGAQRSRHSIFLQDL